MGISRIICAFHCFVSNMKKKYMNLNKKSLILSKQISYPLIAATLTLMAACASDRAPTPSNTKPSKTQGQDLKPIQTPQVAGEGFSFTPRAGEDFSKTMSDYGRLSSVLSLTQAGDDVAPSQYLATQSNSAMGEAVRNEWLKSLGVRQQIGLFKQQYALLPADGRLKEVRCYAMLFGLENDAALLQEHLEETGKASAGCTRLVESRAVGTDDKMAWRRVRGLISNNQITDARNLAAALGSPLDGGVGQGAQENLLRDVISPSAQKSPASAAARLDAISGSLKPEQTSFAWGLLGMLQARNDGNFGTALAYFSRVSDLSALSKEQLEWYVRTALRLERWDDVARVIEGMPQKLRDDSAWTYWLGRAYQQRGKSGEAQALFQKASQTGRNFYALLSLEELGRRVDTRNNIANPTASQLNQIKQDGAIQRALNLFRASSGNWDLRKHAQAEWRYATRGMNETTRLAAAQVAYDNQFYEMAIGTADSTSQLLNYNLRYISPFRDLVVSYSDQAGVDAAWVYGLIRQESRFMLGAKSSVGAQGLMQVMPSTAAEIARRIGMSQSDLYTIEGNIRMGTWYMADARRSLQNNEVMATAGYNAGPSRARKWQANRELEGAIYAETIPFTETRDYVKKVMTNATYYASLLNEPYTSLKQRMGTIPARY